MKTTSQKGDPEQLVPLAKRDSYLIQFKPGTTEQEIAALLKKYDLNATDGISELLILQVEANKNSKRKESAARRLAQKIVPQKLRDVLRPDVIKKLRKEKIIARAVVDILLSTSTLPKPVSTPITTDNGLAYRWDWKFGGPWSNQTEPPDGNWGLKAIRMPPVWTILHNYRLATPNTARPKLAIIDSGFVDHPDLRVSKPPANPTIGAADVTASTPSNVALPEPDRQRKAKKLPFSKARSMLSRMRNSKDRSNVSSSTSDACMLKHGTHVAGIVGAIHNNEIGIDGVIPQANIEAVSINMYFTRKHPDRSSNKWNLRKMSFFDVLRETNEYLKTADISNLRVINLSLGYNFAKAGLSFDDLDRNDELQSTIASYAEMIQERNQDKGYEEKIMIVIAAGNDSVSRKQPINAKWSSPFTWAATDRKMKSTPKNFLVVESVNRSGQRSSFSNIGGHIAAPGEDILSTLGSGEYGLCEGTSQAAPHVAAVATLLFELEPKKTPAEIANIIKSSAIKPKNGDGAPRLDALEAVLRLSPEKNLIRLVDLNRDGKVDIEDMKIFRGHLSAITENRTKGAAFTEDLNGDGVIDANECNWPLIDFNGSGTASLLQSDQGLVLGTMRTDLDVMKLAWTDKTKDFETALRETGLDADIEAANKSNNSSMTQSIGCR